MNLLSAMPAKRCLTAVGYLVQQEKILLILHKKLKIWLAPGGHVETDELPHQTAEREVFEETGIRVRAVSALPVGPGEDSENLPVPLVMNLHWINKDRYLQRTAKLTTQPRATKEWPRGCEQHYVLGYVVQALAGQKISKNEQETNGVDWFRLGQVLKLRTTLDVKREVGRVMGWIKNDQIKLFK